MSKELEKGTVLELEYGNTITVENLLGSGGQGDVYRVKCDGITDAEGNQVYKALKWYKKKALGTDPSQLHNIIMNNINKGAPSSAFLWPEDITKTTPEGIFGYIMDLRKDGYYEISLFLNAVVRFKSFKAVVDASLQIAHAFRLLHNKGYSYQDMNDGNFFINPDNGDVLICDNDNVATDEAPTRILGKPGYMAPELVYHPDTDKNDPNKKLKPIKPSKITDRYSLSVILFMLLCLNHPLEGQDFFNCEVLDDKNRVKFYGRRPVFIMDPKNKKNAAPQGSNAQVIWSYLPSYIKDLFCESFSKSSLVQKPNQRPEEREWIEQLVRFRSEILTCQCGNEVFSDNGVIPDCDDCGKSLAVNVLLEVGKVKIPAVKGTRIYRCQLGSCNAEDALNPCACVVRKKSEPDSLRLKNFDSTVWRCTNTKGDKKNIEKGKSVPLKAGIVVDTGNGVIKMIKK